MMHCTIRLFALALWLAVLAAHGFADTAPAPPAWEDQGASVYLDRKPQSAAPDERYAPASPHVEGENIVVSETTAEPATTASTSAIEVPSVTQASHRVIKPAANDEDMRRLAPQDRNSPELEAGEVGSPTPKQLTASRPLADFKVPFGSLYTVGSALAIVIGAFLLFAWLLRRGGQSTRSLPTEVVSVLGRVPLAARQFAELIRVGNKLVLVSITPTGTEPLTEVTDPVEVDRLVGLCQQQAPNSATKAFEHVFRQLSSESTPPAFLEGQSLPQSISTAAAAYRSQRGERAHG